MRKFIATLGVLSSIATVPFAASWAHETGPGPNGGVKADAGSQYHAELVVAGTPDVVLFLYDAKDKPVPATGFRGTAILVIDGKSHRIPLEPAEGSKMQGRAPLAVPKGVKGVVQLTAPDGTAAQAKY